MSFTVIVTHDFEQMSHVAARIYLKKVNEAVQEKDSFLGILPTGNSPTGLYQYLAEHQDQFDASKVVSFNLDEYVGLPGNTPQERMMHPESYCYFMLQNLFTHLDPTFQKTHVPPGSLVEQSLLAESLKKGANDPACYELAGADKGKAIVIPTDSKDEYLRWIRNEVLDAYIAEIKKYGDAVDVALVGVGGRGHIAFHESGIPLDLEMLLVQLDENTIDNAVTDGHFAKKEDSPHYAVSMGAGAVYSLSKCVLLVANGSRKTGPIAESLLGDVTPDVPISKSQDFAKDQEMIYVLDEAAAEGILSEKDKLTQKGIDLRDFRI